MMTISEYKRRIWIYKNRRKQAYITSRRLTTRISQMQSCLRSREAREKKANDKINSLIKSVNDFFGVDIRSNKVDLSHKLARNIYYKIGIEKQLREVLLCKSVNRNAKAASYGRSVLTKSFKTNPENKKAFHNFKNYFENK
jgi:hypothetical protein